MRRGRSQRSLPRVELDDAVRARATEARAKAERDAVEHAAIEVERDRLKRAASEFLARMAAAGNPGVKFLAESDREVSKPVALKHWYGTRTEYRSRVEKVGERPGWYLPIRHDLVSYGAQYFLLNGAWVASNTDQSGQHWESGGTSETIDLGRTAEQAREKVDAHIHALAAALDEYGA